jgi:hypothetical protein
MMLICSMPAISDFDPTVGREQAGRRSAGAYIPPKTAQLVRAKLAALITI